MYDLVVFVRNAMRSTQPSSFDHAEHTGAELYARAHAGLPISYRNRLPN